MPTCIFTFVEACFTLIRIEFDLQIYCLVSEFIQLGRTYYNLTNFDEIFVSCQTKINFYLIAI